MTPLLFGLSHCVKAFVMTEFLAPTSPKTVAFERIQCVFLASLEFMYMSSKDNVPSSRRSVAKLHCNHTPSLTEPLDTLYEACKDDSVCVRNWLTDWEWDGSGENHCKSKCVPYSEMYANGTDMCQNMWGESFKVSKSSCLCLQMNKKDTIAIKYLLSESSEESSSSSSSSEERSCQKKLLKFEKPEEEEGEQTR
ncbi:riboflavin-binding protein [Pitangus sulphuratus]|nr:riboflavin-binding protein [Pitangus sulphuratus]